MEIRSGLDAASTITAVKDSVAADVRAADNEVEIVATDFFNNTFSPDLVLKWPRRRVERPLFLRTDSTDAYLLEDLDLVQGKEPLLVSLAGVPAQRNEGPKTRSAAQLHTRAKQANALVADRAALAALVNDAATNPVSGLASAVFLRGGSGVVDAPEATEFTSSILAGFVAVQEGDADVTSVALRASRELLGLEEAGEVADLLQALWVGAGQIATSFPGEFSGSSVLDASALRLILDSVNIEENAFWEKVARNVKLEALAQVEASAANTNLQRLMGALARRLSVKAARVTALEADVLESSWAVASGLLTYATGKLRFQFAAHSLNEFVIDGVDVTASALAFASRADAANVHLTGLTFRSEGRRLDYASEDGSSVTGDQAVESLGASLGTDALVTRAGVKADGREMHFNLETATAHGNTKSRFPLSTVLPLAAGLSKELDSNEQETLAALFGEAETEVEEAEGEAGLEG